MTDRLLWTERRCHCDVAEPWSYASFEECGCHDRCHEQRMTDRLVHALHR